MTILNPNSIEAKMLARIAQKPYQYYCSFHEKQVTFKDCFECIDMDDDGHCDFQCRIDYKAVFPRVVVK